jgi:hypothetical protein
VIARTWISTEQVEICERFRAAPLPAPANRKLGISREARDGLTPLNGLRHPPRGDTTGWYIWAGEGGPSATQDFFDPLHVAHLAECCPIVLPYLALPPGWRFLVAPSYEDVWYDAALLEISDA